MTATLSTQEYIKLGGCVCPACKNLDIEGSGVTIGDGNAVQGCFCNACGAQWDDVYELRSYSDLRVPPGKGTDQ